MTKIAGATKAQKRDFEAIHANVQGLIADSLHEYVAALHELAVGVYVEEEVPDPQGGRIRRVYAKEPNFLALTYLLNRNMGSPTQRKEELAVKGTPQDFAALMNQRRERAEKMIPAVEGTFRALTDGNRAATERPQGATQQPPSPSGLSDPIDDAKQVLLTKMRAIRRAN